MGTESVPKYLPKSTWRWSDRSEWTICHWILEILDIHHTNLNHAVPVHQKSDKVPYLSQWQMQRWIIIHAFAPVLLHHAYVQSTGYNLTPMQAFVVYSLALNLIVIRTLHAFRTIGHKTGFLDDNVQDRDGVPNLGVSKVVKSLATAALCRSFFIIFLSYRPTQAPMSLDLLWLPLEVGVYGITLDFWYYWYHRLMHEINFLWDFHRTHHFVKRPNPLLSLYTDAVQEAFDVSIIPLVTYFTMMLMGLRMGFYEWWTCQMFVSFTELAGHSGLRVHAETPNPFTFVLRWFHCELIIEDHDLHHRRGYRVSSNYGKQTRLWDTIFGTFGDRIECRHENVDWNSPLELPLFTVQGK
ncbi:fatty acid hydroxylase superfamily [Fusarium albosuccineum]|uniref:Fatty acid hydroxylase superfamily n=1 Tax=Fusarium albosuccineum TaxID=1237068 RepID=A0A8H4LHF3_9HYPO|nr:fatty acid hydroxylase superfamily [Fusarium albosuccineum]